MPYSTKGKRCEGSITVRTPVYVKFRHAAELLSLSSGQLLIRLMELALDQVIDERQAEVGRKLVELRGGRRR